MFFMGLSEIKGNSCRMTNSGLIKKTQSILICRTAALLYLPSSSLGGDSVISLLSDKDIHLHEVTPNVCASSSKWKNRPLWNSWKLVMPFSWKLTLKTTFFNCFAVWTSVYCWTELREINTRLSNCGHQRSSWASVPLRNCFSEREAERMYCTDVVCWLIVDGSQTDQRVLLWQIWVEVNCRFAVVYNQRHNAQTNRCKETAVCRGGGVGVGGQVESQVCPDTVGKVAVLSLFAFGSLAGA